MGLARHHMSKIREIKKDDAFQSCKKFGKPGSVTDKYRVALRHSDSVEVMDAKSPQANSTNSAGPARTVGTHRGRNSSAPEDGELIRDVEAAQMELEKSIEAVAKAKRKSEIARIRLALANGDPASALSLSRVGTGMGLRPDGSPDVFSLEDEGESLRVSVAGWAVVWCRMLVHGTLMILLPCTFD